MRPSSKAIEIIYFGQDLNTRRFMWKLIIAVVCVGGEGRDLDLIILPGI